MRHANKSPRSISTNDAQRRTLLWLPLVCGLLTHGCGEVVPQTSTTLGSTVITTDTEETISPAGIDGGSVTVSITTGRGTCCNPLTVALTATLSVPALEPLAQYAWNFGDGKTGTERTLEQTFTWTGQYLVSVEVTLPDGTTIEAEHTLTLGIDGPTDTEATPNDPPPTGDGGQEPIHTASVDVVANAGADQIAVPGQTVTLSGTASFGTGDTPIAYLWRQTQGLSVSLNGSSSPLAGFVVPDGAGTLEFELTVTQDYAVDSDRIVITIDGGPPPGGATEPLSANAGADQSVDSESGVVLYGSANGGDPAVPLQYEWQQSQGPTVTLVGTNGVSPTFVAPTVTEGSVVLTFELTLLQGDVTATDNVTVTVVPTPEVPDDPDIPSEAQVLAWMQELDPLPKIHYSFAIHEDLLLPPVQPTLVEFIRLTNGISLTARAPKQHHVHVAVQACKQVNALNPAIPATIAINYSPWHDFFPPDAPPTDFGPDHDEELTEFRTRLLLLKGWLAEANQEYQADIEVRALLFDSERFTIKNEQEDDYQTWNDAIDLKYNAFYIIGKDVFPNARIEMFVRGAIQPCTNVLNFCPKDHYTLNEMGETFMSSLFIVPDTDLMIETFRRTYENAVAHGVTEVNLWVAMAVGWRSTGPKSRVWEPSWDYDTIYTWRLAAQINDPYYGDRPDQYAPWHQAKVIMFYPRAFDARNPYWGKHFVAYVRGAHGIDDLP